MDDENVREPDDGIGSGRCKLVGMGKKGDEFDVGGNEDGPKDGGILEPKSDG